MFATGRPIRTRLNPRGTCQKVDQTVVSVGPYPFHSAFTRVSRISARSFGIASPVQMAVIPPLPFQPESSSSRQVAGVALTNVTPRDSTTEASLRPSVAVSRETIRIRAPTVSGRITSATAMSKDIVVTPSTTPSLESPGVSATLVSRFTTQRFGTRTPFLGLPVEPDV